MQTIRVFTTLLVFGVMTLWVSNGCSDPTQKAAALKTSESDLQRSHRKFEGIMEEKIAAFRLSLDEMKAMAANSTPEIKIITDLHCAELDRQLKAVETGLIELKAMRTGNQALAIDNGTLAVTEALLTDLTKQGLIHYPIH